MRQRQANFVSLTAQRSTVNGGRPDARHLPVADWQRGRRARRRRKLRGRAPAQRAADALRGAHAELLNYYAENYVEDLAGGRLRPLSASPTRSPRPAGTAPASSLVLTEPPQFLAAIVHVRAVANATQAP